MSSTDVPIRTLKPIPLVAFGVVAIVIAIAVNAGIAYLTRSWDPNGTRIGLMLVAYGPMTALGVIVGTAGWATVRQRASEPRAVLRVLVPAVLAVSFIPGVVLLVLGNSVLNVVGLWIMHLVVAAVTVTTASQVLPLADKNT